MTKDRVSAADVGAAGDRIRDHVVRTRSDPSLTLTALTGTELVVKFENLQFTGSFKDRGSANKLLQLTTDEARRGVIAASAGNHAQGVAHHARRLGIPATIVMPSSAPFAKVRNTEALGASVIQVGATFHDTRAEADRLADEHGYTFIHPFDDPAIIAGQGTVAVELMADHPDLDTIVVPCGGGGLLAGMALWARATEPSVEVIGVQSAAYPAMAVLMGATATTGSTYTLADGIAVARPGELTRAIIGHNVDDIVLVSEGAIEAAIAMFLEIEKTVAEGAGAVPLAAVLEHPHRFAGRRVGLVLSGGNIDTRVLASVLMRELVHSGRIVNLRVTLDDLPGQLAPVIETVAAVGANLVEIEHRRLFDPISARRANVDLVIETRDRRHTHALMTSLREAGYEVTDQS